MAVDATPVIPTLRIKGNTVYGLGTELEVIATTAQDVIDIVRKPNKPMYLLLVQEHNPSFVLVISPVINGQDFFTLDTSFNNALQWCSAKCIKLIDLRAD